MTSYTETYDERKLCYAVEHIDDFFNRESQNNTKKRSLKFLEQLLINNNKMVFNYSFSKNTEYGRKYSYGIQSTPKQIRNFLLSGSGVVDYDIKNAHPTILHYLCLKHNIKTSGYLYSYVHDRDNVVKTHFQQELFNNVDVKKLILTATNSDDALYSDNKWLRDYQADMMQIRQQLREIKDYEKIVDDTKKIKHDGKNLNSSFVNRILCKVESEIIDEIASYVCEKSYKVFALMFDGLMIYDGTPTLLDGINKLVKTTYGDWFEITQKEILSNIDDTEYNYDKSKVLANILADENPTTNAIDWEDRTDDVYAQLVADKAGDDFVLTDDNIYVYYKNMWIKNNLLLCKSVIKKCIREVTTDAMDVEKELQRKLDANSGQYKNSTKTVANIAVFAKGIAMESKANNVLGALKCILATRQDKVEFDVTKPHVFCFDNVAYDLNTRQKTTIYKTDYITLTSGYDYIEPDPQDVENVDRLIDTIMPDPEAKRTLNSILRTALSGIRQEKIFMFNGCGRNGKGLIDELLMDCVGNYGHKGNIAVLTKEIKAGANPEVANLDKKRFVVFNEPNDNECICGGNIKRLTGDDRLDARGLYENNTKGIMLALTLIVEVNKKPRINSRIDESIVARFINLVFGSYFTTDKKELETLPNAKLGNPDYKTYAFRDKYKHALFKYLLDWTDDTIYICNSVRENTKEYLMDNDDMLEWINDYYTKTDDPSDYVKLPSMHKAFKELQGSKGKAMTRKNFIQEVSSNMEMRKYFKEKHQPYVDGKQLCLRNVIVGWKEKEFDDEESDEVL